MQHTFFFLSFWLQKNNATEERTLAFASRKNPESFNSLAAVRDKQFG